MSGHVEKRNYLNFFTLSIGDNLLHVRFVQGIPVRVIVKALVSFLDGSFDSGTVMKGRSIDNNIHVVKNKAQTAVSES